MRLMRSLCVPLFVPFLLLLAVSCSKEGEKNAEPPVPSIDDTLSLQDAAGRISAYLFACGVGDTAAGGLFNRALDSAAAAMKRRFAADAGGPGRLDSLLDMVYRSWNITFDPRDTAAETLLPHCVFRNRKGACLGVSLIILMLAEKLDLPVFGVLLPGHFFCRYDDGKLRINIEPNRQGFPHPDEYYRQRYPLAHRPGYGLENLDKKSVIGILCYNAGTLCLKSRNYGAAVRLYRECMRRVPGFAEAKGNCAVACARRGSLDTALVLFNELFIAHPDMVNLAANYGYVATAAKHYLKAAEIYKKGLDYFPDDTVLRKRLEKLTSGSTFFRTNKKKE